MGHAQGEHGSYGNAAGYLQPTVAVRAPQVHERRMQISRDAELAAVASDGVTENRRVPRVRECLVEHHVTRVHKTQALHVRYDGGFKVHLNNVSFVMLAMDRVQAESSGLP